MNRRLPWAVGLLSAGMIAFQLSLMQILSICQWNHFAYMVISMAMLGLGTSGTVLFFLKKKLLKKKELYVPALMILTSVSMVAILFFSGRVFGGFDSYLVFYQKKHYADLLLTYFVLYIPFFLGACALGLTYISHASGIGKLYFADLTGSGLAGLLMLFLFWHFSPERLPVIIACFPFLAGIIAAPAKGIKTIAGLGLIAGSILLAGALCSVDLPLSQYKSLSRTLLLPGARVMEEVNSPYGHLTRVKAQSLRYAPGLSLTYSGSVPVQEVLFNNGDWLGPILAFDTSAADHFLDHTTHNLPFVTGEPGSVFIAGAATGLYADHARVHGVQDIIATQTNKAAMELLKRNSVIPEPPVHFTGVHPRNLLLSGSLYDLIILPETESFGGSAGIHALKEQFLFTTRSFSKMWDCLTPYGMISATVWMDFPARNSLKLLATMVQIAESKTAGPPAEHIMAVRSWATVTLILKKSRITSLEITKLKDFCEREQFDPLLYPGIDPSSRDYYNSLQDDSFFSSVDQIMLPAPERKAFFKEYDFNIKPATDSKPYFSQFLKLNRLSKMKDVFGAASVPFLETGYLIVLVTFLQITAAALLFILLPLFFIKTPGGKKASSLVFFGAIGIGYMFVEMVFIKEYTVYFGDPLYAASAVLSAMLFFSGAGAYVSRKVVSGNYRFRWLIFLITVILLLLAAGLTPLLNTTAGLPLWLKLCLSFVITGPLSFLMGMMFPSGIRALSLQKKDHLVPWAWGVNGALSVISTVLATIFAVELGFSVVILVAAVAYFMAGLVVRFRLFSIFAY
ncbi:MAG TPA: hypothetical protein PLC77_05320 [Bacteroidales bacterium]|nr:hypothetical protein [Bacteroidales bacterium]